MSAERHYREGPRLRSMHTRVISRILARIPGRKGSSRFFLRTVGPMVAPEHRVLVLDPSDPTASDAAARGADVTVGEVPKRGGWDLVLWRRPRPGPQLDALLAALPELLGDRGRLVVVVTSRRTADAISAALPPDFRVVVLARELGLFSRRRALSIGVDLEARRARRHAERKRTAGEKAAVSRRRWERGETDASAEEIARVMEQGAP